MITFKQFLAEAGTHKKAIDTAEAVKLINTHCRDILKSGKWLYRGMTGGSDAFVLHGEASLRKSANTTNYYTVIMDHFLPREGYPKRSQSIILTTEEHTARGFGRPYVIFPYDGVKIGVCSQSDFWFSPPFKIGHSEKELRVDYWNDIWDGCDLSASSYEDFVNSVKAKMQGEGRTAEKLKDIFGTPDEVEKALENAYSSHTLQLELATTKTISHYDGAHELWIGGPCVAIEYEAWERIQDDEMDQHLAPDDDEGGE